MPKYLGATRVVRAGREAALDRRPDPGEPFLAGPVFAAPYLLPGNPADTPYGYARFANPTWTRYERAIAELEGGPALVFASGMAAVSAIFLATLRPGDVVVVPADAYYTTRLLAADFFARYGIDVRQAPTAGDAQERLLDGCRLLWLESPSNPGLDVCDISALARTARDAGALVAVDNTTATGLHQQPLNLGADYVVASDSKALTGHADLLLGHVAAATAELLGPIQTVRTRFGSVPGPMETWLAHRSLATADVRLDRQCATALELAQVIAVHPAVVRCRYPGLPADPAHEVAERQMSRYGQVVSFTLTDGDAADRFLAAAQLIWPATSFGGVVSSAERRDRWGGDDVPPGFIRLSVGCEDASDLIDDVQQALDAVHESAQ
jgi:cystathionine gamma-lyase